MNNYLTPTKKVNNLMMFITERALADLKVMNPDFNFKMARGGNIIVKIKNGKKFNETKFNVTITYGAFTINFPKFSKVQNKALNDINAKLFLKNRLSGRDAYQLFQPNKKINTDKHNFTSDCPDCDWCCPGLCGCGDIAQLDSFVLTLSN